MFQNKLMASRKRSRLFQQSKVLDLKFELLKPKKVIVAMYSIVGANLHISSEVLTNPTQIIFVWNHHQIILQSFINNIEA